MGVGSRGFFVKVRVLLPPQVFPLGWGGGGGVAGDSLSRCVSCFHLRYFRWGGGGGVAGDSLSRYVSLLPYQVFPLGGGGGG